MQDIDLSLIIPCYNEEPILLDSIKLIFESMDNTQIRYEIIFVDDCSQDNTRNLIDRVINEYKNKRFVKIFHEVNKGRGGTVTDGIMASKGKISGFFDIDCSTHPRYIPVLVWEIQKGADMATALRVYKLNWLAAPRWVLSKGYKFLVKLWLRLDLSDTETGCKFFNREKIVPILSEICDNYWFWDTEIMVRSYLKGLKIVEIPSVFIRKGFYTRVKIVRDCFRQFISLIKFKQELKRKGILKGGKK